MQVQQISTSENISDQTSNHPRQIPKIENILIQPRSRKTMKDNISRKAEIKFFLAMVTTFFILPILIIQIPGIEKIGETILKPFDFILNYN